MIKIKNTCTLILLFICFFIISSVIEAKTSQIEKRNFKIPQHGELILSVPSSWEQNIRQPSNELPPTITFSPDKGDEFKVLITALWSPKKDKDFNKSQNIKRLIENDLRGMLPRAVEKDVEIKKITGVDGEGFYFLVTDKTPEPDGYPYAIRAGVGVGDLLLSVTVLSRDKTSIGITATIAALKKAENER